MFRGSEKRIPEDWKHLLEAESIPMTLDQYMAKVLIHQTGMLLDAMLSLQHLEGMVGAIDDAFDRHDSDYAGSAAFREALDKQRDTLRALGRANGTAKLPAGGERSA
jgi:hypothetical protein